MSVLDDDNVRQLMIGIGVMLVVVTIAGRILRRALCNRPIGRRVVGSVNESIRGWWIMALILCAALLAGQNGALILFALVSVLALREFVALTPGTKSDHRSLVWAFFIITPLQYILVGQDLSDWFLVGIPVFGFAIIATRNAIAGDTNRYLERTASLQWALLSCVYCISFMPAMLQLDIPDFEGEVALLLFLVVVAQVGDIVQFLWSSSIGGSPVLASVNPQATVQGFVAGVIVATLAGTGLWWATPFSFGEAALFALLITLLGSAGRMVMNAIKRDRGITQFSRMIEGHGGVLDRVDSLIFAAPVFYLLLRQLYS